MAVQSKIVMRTLIGIILVLGLIAALARALYPAYTSPNSRLWSSSLGYPNLLRMLKEPIPVSVAEVAPRDMARILTADGAVTYLNEIPVNVEVVGMVTELNARLGDRVKTGDVLLRLDSGGHVSRIAKLDVELKRNQYEEALKDYNRELDAFDKGLIARTVLNQFQRTLEEAQIAYQRAREAYDNSLRSRSASVLAASRNGLRKTVEPSGEVEILSPVDGTIIRQQVTLGENLVRPKENVFAIGDRLVFKAGFDQRYLGWVQDEMPVRIHLSAFPGRVFEGQVMRVDRQVSASASAVPGEVARMAFGAWIRSDELEREAAYGMNGYCVIERPLNALAIPENALMRFSGREGLVLVVNEQDRIEVRPVSYSLSLNGWVAIEQGLRQGERVVAGGLLGLKDGDRVVIQ